MYYGTGTIKRRLYGNFRNVSDQDVVDGVFFNALEDPLFWDNSLMRQNTYWKKDNKKNTYKNEHIMKTGLNIWIYFLILAGLSACDTKQDWFDSGIHFTLSRLQYHGIFTEGHS